MRAKLKKLRREIRKYGLGCVMLFMMDKIGIPQPVARFLARCVKIVMRPRDYIRRRVVAGSSQPMVTVDPSLGYAGGIALPGAEKLVRYLSELYDRKSENLTYERPYTFVSGIVRMEDGPVIEAPDELAPIVEFVTQEAVVDIVENYMGETPVISNISLIYTPVGTEIIGPQNFHRDMNCKRQLHLLLHIFDVTEDSGPFTFIPASRSNQIIKTYRHRGGRMSDDDILRAADSDDVIRCIGRAGSVFLVNPYDCFHYGARATVTPRYILIVNFTSIFEHGEGQNALYRATNRFCYDDGTERRRKLLNIPHW